jgi:hypothetical protein
MTTTAINNPESIPATRPAGRPLGSRNQRTIFVEAPFTDDAEKVKAIVNTAIQRAIEGDADFSQLVLARIAPEPEGPARSISYATSRQDL